MKGFFSSSQIQATSVRETTLPQCGKCGLLNKCNSPKMEVMGEGRKEILVISEAPGSDEDNKGVSLVGNSGQELTKHFQQVGINIRKDCWFTNSIICKPPSNRPPSPKELMYCRPNLRNTIKKLNPRIIITLGGSAIKQLISGYWKEGNIGGAERWAGWKIPHQKTNTWICPTWHPSFLLKSSRGEFSRTGNPVLNNQFSKHLLEAVSLQGRPWKKVPDYKSQVEVILEPVRAAKIIRKMIKNGGVAAFDYEGTSLKPEWEGSEIVSCSIAWGKSSIKRCIAYPWQGEAIRATQEFLKSPIHKIASNLKFEDRWTRAEFGHGAKNWFWDTMLASHVIDNRKGINGLKFQAFVRLGCPDYDAHIKPYLKSKKLSKLNRIREIRIQDLLVYNGLDSLLEWEVAFQQTAELGVDWPY